MNRNDAESALTAIGVELDDSARISFLTLLTLFLHADGGNGGGGNDLELAKKERESLAKVVLDKFTAAPKTVPRFGSVELAWEVTLPEDPIFDITITLNKEAVPPKGTASRTLAQSTAFTLAAVTDHAGRLLRSLTVTVDHSECQTRVLDAFTITSILKNEFDSRFTGSNKAWLKNSDPAHREFLTTALILSPTGFSITACPKE